MQIVFQNMPRFMASLIVQFWSTNEKEITPKLDIKEISYSPDPTMNSKFGFNEISQLSRISYNLFLKFGHSEEHTKFEKMLHLNLTSLSNVKFKRKI